MLFRSGDEWKVQGRICCIRRTQDPALLQILQRFENSSVFVNKRRTPVKPVKTIDGRTDYFIEATTAKHMFSIELEEKNEKAYYISGMPFKIATLVARSGLNSVFGSKIHRVARERGTSKRFRSVGQSPEPKRMRLA